MQYFFLTLFLSFATISHGQSFEKTKSFESWKEKMNNHSNAGELDSALYYSGKILAKLSGKKSPKNFVKIGRQKAIFLLKMGKMNDAYEVLLELLPICAKNKTNFCGECAKLHNTLAKIHAKFMDYPKAIDYLLNTCDSERNREFHYLIASYNSSIGDTTKAIQYSQEWINLSKELGITQHIDAYNSASMIAREMGLLELERTHLNEALRIVELNDLDTSVYAYIYGNLGFSYSESGQDDLALHNLLIDAKYSELYEDKSSYARVVITLAQFDNGNQNYEEAVSRISYALENYGDELKDSYKLEMYQLLKVNYLKLNRLDQYAIYSELWSTLYEQRSENYKEDALGLSNQFKLSELETLRKQHQLEADYKNQVILSERIEAENRENKLYVILLLIALVLIVTGFLFWRYRIVQSKKLNESKFQIERESHEKERLLAKLEEEASQSRLLSLELHMKQEYASQIVEKLKEIDELSIPKVKEIELFIQNGLEIKSVEAILQSNLGDISHQFKATLTKHHSNLTDSEFKLASCVLMKMSNSEIAIGKGISVDSVKKNKYRFKKKMGLEPDDNLYAYLLDLME
jgi:DNA-binding CsgD family transcriptional regulator